MTGVAQLVDTVFEHGVVMVAVVVAVIAFAVRFGGRCGRILADAYARPVADSVLHGIANRIVMVVAFVISRRAPRLAETVDEQLQMLQECQRDEEASAIDLLRHALSFPFTMWSTARSKQETTRRHVDLALPPDDEGTSVVIRVPTVEVKAEVAMPIVVGQARGHVAAPAEIHVGDSAERLQFPDPEIVRLYIDDHSAEDD